jgi:hypothetical protein
MANRKNTSGTVSIFGAAETSFPRCCTEKTDLVVIHSGMTSQLQPLDVSVSKPFKHLVCKHCDAWLNKDSQMLTPSGKIKRSMSVVVEWISIAWK